MRRNHSSAPSVESRSVPPSRSIQSPSDPPVVGAPVAGAPVVDPGRTRAVLVVVALALMTVVSAVSGLNVALPDLARETGASQTQLTWIVDAYTVVFAGLLLVAGALGDRFGRKHLLTVGLVVFAAAALAGSLTDDPTTLIAVRAVMGLGAAAIMPTTLSVITTSFPAAERPKAIGVWVGVAGGGAVLGLFATGLLLEWFAWNSFFVLNVALAVLALVGTLALVPELGRPRRRPARPRRRRPVARRGERRGPRHHRGAGAGMGRPPDHRCARPPASRPGSSSSAGSCGTRTRSSTRGCSGCAASPPARWPSPSSSSPASASSSPSLQYLQFVADLSPLMAAVCLLPLPVRHDPAGPHRAAHRRQGRLPADRTGRPRPHGGRPDGGLHRGHRLRLRLVRASGSSSSRWGWRSPAPRRRRRSPRPSRTRSRAWRRRSTTPPASSAAPSASRSSAAP